MLSSSLNTRRWPRHRVDLPVRIVIPNGRLTSTVPGHATEISGSGMALRSTLGLKPGDLMQVEFPTSKPSGVMAVVRNHKDDCFGVEFLSQLPSRHRTLNKSNQTCDPKTLFAGLRRKQLEIMQVQREIEALNLVILLLADDKKECAASSLPHRSELGRSFGVKFLSQVPPRDRTLNKSNQTCDPKTLFAGLRRKQLEIMQVQREIEALNLAILLLADDKKECAESPLLHRSELGRSFGVKFLSQVPPRDRTLNKSNQTCDPKTLFAGLRRKQLEIMQVQREIEALNLVILLLADDKKECAESPLPHPSELDRRPWPSLAPKRDQQKPLSL